MPKFHEKTILKILKSFFKHNKCTLLRREIYKIIFFSNQHGIPWIYHFCNTIWYRVFRAKVERVGLFPPHNLRYPRAQNPNKICKSHLLSPVCDSSYKLGGNSPAGFSEANNRNPKTKCEICSKLIKIPERRQWSRSDNFIVDFEQISQFLLVLQLLTFNK